MSPAVQFALLASGILAIYVETIWPGRYVPGILGITACLSALYFLGHRQSHPEAFAVLIGSVVLFFAEAFWRPDFVWGVCAAGLLVAALNALFTGRHSVSGSVKTPVAVTLAGLTLYLVAAAKRSRRRKRAGLMSESAGTS